MATVQFFCDTCHFFYVIDEYDVACHKELHRKYHDAFVNGIKATALKNDKVISDSNGFKIILVSPESSLLQRKRAERIAFRSKIGTDYDFASYHADDSKHQDFPLAFIGVFNNRAIGFLVLRKTKRTAKVTWEYYYQENRSNIPLLPDERWGVSMIWVLESKRRMGYASQLIKAVSGYIESSVSEMAWLTPFTEFGYQLAKHISPIEVILSA